MKRCAILIVCALLALTGCSAAAREPDNLDLVRVLGIDGVSPVMVAAFCGRDAEGEIKSGWVVSGSFEQACREIPWSEGTAELSLTGVSHLLIGPGVELEAVLYAVLEHEELGATASVWLMETSCAALLVTCRDPAAELGLLTLQGIRAPTVAQAIAALSSEREITLPCLGLREGRLEEQGVRRWSTEK